jgi:lipoic acid synthetase
MERKPKWLTIPHRGNENLEYVAELLKTLNLNTVCVEAKCPNLPECFENKTATFMILGANCTRNCRFCNVQHNTADELDLLEPEKIATATKELGLDYIVITSVTRDDLSDGGALQFANTIKALKEHCPNTKIEVLIPDFKGDLKALKTVAMAGPDVISHNVETVPALYKDVRPEAIYTRSLEVISNIKSSLMVGLGETKDGLETTPSGDFYSKSNIMIGLGNTKNELETTPSGGFIYSKSSIMLGLGETREQVIQVMNDLRNVECDFLTIGQYLAPTKQHYPVREYIHPDIFDDYKNIALEKGFKHVASGPFVRSSYNAGEAINFKSI